MSGEIKKNTGPWKRAADMPRITAEEIDALRVLAFSGNALVQLVEGLKGSMEHGTWRDEKGNRLKDTNEWALFYTTFKKSADAAKAISDGKMLLSAASDLLQACIKAEGVMVSFSVEEADAINVLRAAIAKAEGRS